MFAESFAKNLITTTLIAFLLILTFRSFLLANLKTSEFSGDMQNFFQEDDNNLEIRACNVCNTPKTKRTHHCSFCERFFEIKYQIICII